MGLCDLHVHPISWQSASVQIITISFGSDNNKAYKAKKEDQTNDILSRSILDILNPLNLDSLGYILIPFIFFINKTISSGYVSLLVSCLYKANPEDLGVFGRGP